MSPSDEQAVRALARKAWPDARDLGPELDAEGWLSMGDDLAIIYLHGPSRRSVSIVPQPAGGYWVGTTQHDEHGNPGEGDGLYLASYGEALRQARAQRRALLAERRDVALADQLTIPGAEP